MNSFYCPLFTSLPNFLSGLEKTQFGGSGRGCAMRSCDVCLQGEKGFARQRCAPFNGSTGGLTTTPPRFKRFDIIFGISELFSIISRKFLEFSENFAKISFFFLFHTKVRGVTCDICLPTNALSFNLSTHDLTMQAPYLANLILILDYVKYSL